MSKLETGLHYPLKLDVLPPDWQVGYVGNFADEIQPGFASGKHNKEGAGIPHIRPFNIDRQGKLDLSEIKSVAPDSDAKRLRTNDVLFNNTNSPELIGKTAVIAAAGDWGFSNHMTRIRFKDDVAPKFAAYQLHFLWMIGYYLHNCVKHVNQASISSKALANAVPFIAPPLNQQKHIVAEIEKQFSRLDEAVANLKRVKANLKRYKAAVLKAAVEGRLVETEAELARREGRSFETGDQLLQRILETRRSQWKGKGKYKTPAVPDTADLLELPEGWMWASLDQLCAQIADVDHKMPKAHGGGIPYVSTKDFTGDNDIDFAGAKRISAADYDALCKKVRPVRGDILLSRYGTVGEVRVVTTDMPFQASYSVAILKPVNDYEITDFIATSVRSDVVQSQIRRDVRATAQPDLGLAHIRQFVVPLPSLREQHRIIVEIDRRLSLVRGVEGQVDANLKRAERLRQSILTTAFSGRFFTSAVNLNQPSVLQQVPAYSISSGRD